MKCLQNHFLLAKYYKIMGCHSCNMRVLGALLIFFSAFVGGVYSFQIGNNGSRQVSFDRFDGTCRGHKVPIIFNYYGIKNEGTTIWMNSTITAKEDISTEPLLSFRIQRCKNRENLDTCEEFHHYLTDKFCSLIESDSDLWSPFFRPYTPKWKCPIKKGVYRAVNSMLDVSEFLLFPMDAWVWRVTAELQEKDTDRLLMCLFVEAHFIAKATN